MSCRSRSRRAGPRPRTARIEPFEVVVPEAVGERGGKVPPPALSAELFGAPMTRTRLLNTNEPSVRSWTRPSSADCSAGGAVLISSTKRMPPCSRSRCPVAAPGSGGSHQRRDRDDTELALAALSRGDAIGMQPRRLRRPPGCWPSSRCQAPRGGATRGPTSLRGWGRRKGRAGFSGSWPGRSPFMVVLSVLRPLFPACCCGVAQRSC